MNVELSEQEARALVQLIDIAIKAGGLSVAPVAVLIAHKVDTAMKEPMKEPPAKPNLEVVSNEVIEK